MRREERLDVPKATSSASTKATERPRRRVAGHGDAGDSGPDNKQIPTSADQEIERRVTAGRRNRWFQGEHP